MTQTDLNVANGTGAAVRADINSHLEALVEMSAGAVAPSTTFPNQLWFDTANNIVKKRNNTNTTWLNFLLDDGTNLHPYARLPLNKKGSDIASGAALSPGSDGDIFDVTGTTTITSIDSVGVGAVITLQFDGALTLTHNATDLVLPGGANITTSAGDTGIFIEYASGDWRLIGGTLMLKGLLNNTANGFGASLIGVEDSGGNFTGTDVEAVLTELFANSSGFTTLTEQATTSGTSFDFTVPTSAKFIVVAFEGVSLSGSDDYLVQLGDAGGVETTGYTSRSYRIGSAGATTSTAGMNINSANSVDFQTGLMNLMHMGGNSWVGAHNVIQDSGGSAVHGAASKTLSGAITTVRVTRSGSDTFDAGAVNVMYG